MPPPDLQAIRFDKKDFISYAEMLSLAGRPSGFVEIWFGLPAQYGLLGKKKSRTTRESSGRVLRNVDQLAG
jgi:hypothetical protein